MKAIRFNRKEFSDRELEPLSHLISGDEVRMYWANKHAQLPIHIYGDNRLVEWGSKDPGSRLPKTGFCKVESLEAGKWRHLNPQPIEVLSSFALSNGVWFQVRKAMRGILIYDEKEHPHAYIVTQASTHYFNIMTGADRMPILLDQIL